MTGAYGDLLGGAEAIARMISAIFNVALYSFDMLLALAGSTPFIFHLPILLSVF